jgi:hypothetical protein
MGQMTGPHWKLLQGKAARWGDELGVGAGHMKFIRDGLCDYSDVPEWGVGR